MTTYYIIFREDGTVDTSLEKDFEQDQYTYIKSRTSDAGNLEYYAHNTIADFYKKILVDGVLA